MCRSPPAVSIPHFEGQGKAQVSAKTERTFEQMKPCTKGHQRSRLRVDPFILLQLLTEQHLHAFPNCNSARTLTRRN